MIKKNQDIKNFKASSGSGRIKKMLILLAFSVSLLWITAYDTDFHIPAQTEQILLELKQAVSTF